MIAWYFRKDVAGERYELLLRALLATSAEFAFVWDEDIVRGVV